jgi:hypothetical protein
LGVRFGGPLRDLRRAYTRLIRTYKPEQYPEQFRLIRAAYDWLLPFARAGDSPPATADELQPAPVPMHSEEAPADEPLVVSTPDAAPQRPPRQPPTPTLDEELEALWDKAVGGDLAAAYGRLVELQHQHAGKVDLYQRLWWLLRCDPTLGRGDVAADWLVRGLRTTGFAGPLRELYREAVEDDPLEAFSERFACLLETPAPPEALAEAFEWRIRAAARTGNWDVIAADVRRLGERFRQSDENVWLRLLFALADGLAWESGQTAGELLKICQTEIKRMEHLAADFSGPYDRFDLLMTVAPGYRALAQRDDISADLLEIVRLARLRPFLELQPRLKSILGEIARDPQLWLTYFDRIQEKSPGLLALFGQLLEQYESNLESPPPLIAAVETANELLQDFLGRWGEYRYANCRGWFLELCLREALTTEQVVEIAPNLSGAWATAGTVFARSLAADWPLRYLCRAWHLFWA